MKKVVVIAVHPDDETLGAGGTLLKHKASGDEVTWIIITDVKDETRFSTERIKSRAEEIKKVSELYGFKETVELGFPTMCLTDESLLKMIPKLSDTFARIEPEIIYTVNRSDAHSDHRITFDAVFACTKSFRYPYIKRVLMYETVSETEFAPALPEKVFQPNYFVDVSDYMNQKLEAMEIFESEVSDHPFPRSLDNLKALAHFRGASVGVHYAEAFQLLKYIDK